MTIYGMAMIVSNETRNGNEGVGGGNEGAQDLALDENTESLIKKIGMNGCFFGERKASKNQR